MQVADYCIIRGVVFYLVAVAVGEKGRQLAGRIYFFVGLCKQVDEITCTGELFLRCQIEGSLQVDIPGIIGESFDQAIQRNVERNADTTLKVQAQE